MGPVKFTIDDFDAFFQKEEDFYDIHRITHEKLEKLVKEVVQKNFKDKFLVYKENLKDEYLGVDLLPKGFSKNKPSEVVHISIGLEKNMLRSYIILGSQKLNNGLVKIFKNNLQSELEQKIYSLPVLDYNCKPKLRVYEKWHFHQGMEYYIDNFISEINLNSNVLENTIQLIHRITSQNNSNLKHIFPKQNYRRGYVGLFCIEYQLYYLFVNEIGYKVEDFIKKSINGLIPIYDLLSKELDQMKK